MNNLPDQAVTTSGATTFSNTAPKYVNPDDPTGFIRRAHTLLAEYEWKQRAHHKAGTRAPIRQAGLIPERNGPCPCGSGKKYKKCCRARVPYVG